jgi:hypothetical protein
MSRRDKWLLSVCFGFLVACAVDALFFSADAAMVATTNYALNQPATASSVEQDLEKFNPEYAVDGDPTTRWSSSKVDPSWLQVDLGENKYIWGVTLKWERAVAKDFKVQTSKDGTNWSNRKTITDNIDLQHDLLMTGVYGRYVRIYCTARATTYAYSIRELEVYTKRFDKKIKVTWDADTTPADCSGLDPEDCFARWDKVNVYMNVDDGPHDFDHPVAVSSQSYENGKSTPTEVLFNVEFDVYKKTKVGVICRSAKVNGGEETESIDSDPAYTTVDLTRPTKLTSPEVTFEQDGKVRIEWELHTDPRVETYLIGASDEETTGYKTVATRTHEGEVNNPSGKGNAVITKEEAGFVDGQMRYFNITTVTSADYASVHSRWGASHGIVYSAPVVIQVNPVRGLNIILE